MKVAYLSLLLIGSFLLNGCSQSSLGGSKQTSGTLIGGGAGAVLGAQVGKGHGKLMATAVGAILGAALGNDIGQSLDEVDKMKVTQAFTKAMDTHLGSTIQWNNPNTNHSGSVVSLRDGRSTGGEYCREYQQTITIGGKQQMSYGTACRQADGQWKVIN